MNGNNCWVVKHRLHIRNKQRIRQTVVKSERQGAPWSVAEGRSLAFRASFTSLRDIFQRLLSGISCLNNASNMCSSWIGRLQAAFVRHSANTSEDGCKTALRQSCFAVPPFRYVLALQCGSVGAKCRILSAFLQTVSFLLRHSSAACL